MQQIEIVGTLPIDAGTLSMLASLAQIGLLVVSCIAAGFAYFSVEALHRERLQQLNIAKANFLMQIDLRWDSEELRKARRLFFATAEDIKKIVSGENPVASDGQKDTKIKEKWESTLNQMRNNDLDNYMTLMAICGFFETVGLMVHREYIELDDVKKLLMGPIVGLDQCFRAHINSRRNEMGVPNGLYEHALYLCDLAQGTKSQN